MENLIMQGILFSFSDEITPEVLGISDTGRAETIEHDPTQNLSYKDAKEKTLTNFNHAYIGSLLAANDGNVTHAAKSCGMERQALQQIMRRYGITASQYRNA
jgi:DNA-binding NtrC family response regulator